MKPRFLDAAFGAALSVAVTSPSFAAEKPVVNLFDPSDMLCEITKVYGSPTLSFRLGYEYINPLTKDQSVNWKILANNEVVSYLKNDKGEFIRTPNFREVPSVFKSVIVPYYQVEQVLKFDSELKPLEKSIPQDDSFSPDKYESGQDEKIIKRVCKLREQIGDQLPILGKLPVGVFDKVVGLGADMSKYFFVDRKTPKESRVPVVSKYGAVQLPATIQKAKVVESLPADKNVRKISYPNLGALSLTDDLSPQKRETLRNVWQTSLLEETVARAKEELPTNAKEVSIVLVVQDGTYIEAFLNGARSGNLTGDFWKAFTLGAGDIKGSMSEKIDAGNRKKIDLRADAVILYR